MKEKKKTLLEQRIEQFCQSSGELLSGIHVRHNGDGTSKRKRKGKKEIISIPDLDMDFHGDEPLEDLF